jgi:hypothetical protein
MFDGVLEAMFLTPLCIGFDIGIEKKPYVELRVAFLNGN